MPNGASAVSTPSTTTGGAPLVYHRSRDFSAVISTGFRYIHDHWRTLYRPLFFICLPLVVIGSLLLGSFFHNIGPEQTPGPTNFLSMIAGYLLFVLAYIVACVVVCEYMRLVMDNNDRRPTTREVWRSARRHFWLYLALSIVTSMISSLGSMMFFLPGIFLQVVFQFSYPLYALERASFGDAIGRAFSLVWGKWWFTFALLLVLTFMGLLLNGAVDVPVWLLTSFLSISGINWMDDADGAVVRMRIFLTVISLITSSVYMLLVPFVQVPMNFHVLSVAEQKDAPGLLREVEEINIDVRA